MTIPTFDTHVLGLFEGHGDVGSATKAGSATYDPSTQTYTIAGAGTNMWLDQDEFHFVWKRMRGNFILTARAQFVGTGVNEHRKVGCIVRSGLASNAPHVNAVVHGDGLSALQYRRTVGGPTEEVRSSVTGADVIQLERKGTTYILSLARFGEPFVVEQVTDIGLGDELYAGLFVCSHDADVVEQATFSNVRIVVPAKDDFVPYRDYLGSYLEILDVETGHRQVIYGSGERFEAPNWTPDGKALIYNSHGHLYRFDLAQKTPTVIDTGLATTNNNDHVLSFDGTMIAISDHSEEKHSIVYTLPIGGGTPKRITAQGPSYLHGWSPDGKYLVYTGQRDGDFNIYRISADGGDETALTSGDALDDGPEYTPDGDYVYFNSTRSGTMQIWRMQPDGSDQEQVTDDEHNNWFAHISPDGQQIIFLTFSSEVDPRAHPPYKRVYLRHIPAAGGTPKVLAYLYGGQGTINVPSWSPDNQHVAFVSNTGM